MSQFDKVYKELIETVLDKGVMSTGNVRTVYADGTPAHYISYIGYQFRLDNSGDEAQLITSRYAPYKSAIREIYWIWKMRSNDTEELEKLGCGFWKEWAKKDINNRTLVYVKPRTCKDLCKPVYKVRDILNPDLPLHKGTYGDYYILDEYIEKNNIYYNTIQFKDTGYVKRKYKHHLDTKDPYRITVFNMGCYGECNKPEIIEYFGKLHRTWIRKWENIIRRVAGVADRNKWYKNTTLGYDFQCCEKFLEWVMKNNTWGRENLSNLDVDKDYYSSNCYSGDTCVLIPHILNSRLNSDFWYLFEGYYFFSLTDLGLYLLKRGYNVSMPGGRIDIRRVKRIISSLMTQLKIERINHHVPTSNGEYPRFKFSPLFHIGKSYGSALNIPTAMFSNQVDYIINEIKNNPNSRRIISEIWLPSSLNDMALYPCAHLSQWSVVNGKLYLEVRQRSCDIALGLVANVFQYSVLHKLIAKECELEPADLIWTIHNAHIYDRHIEDLKKQIELPTLSGFKLDLSKVNSFSEWSNPDDITVPQYADVVTNKIKYEVAI